MIFHFFLLIVSFISSLFQFLIYSMIYDLIVLVFVGLINDLCIVLFYFMIKIGQNLDLWVLRAKLDTFLIKKSKFVTFFLFF